VYAKACGIIGKSFVGKRLAGLGAVTRLSELDRLAFPQSFRELPERELLTDLEQRIIARSAEQIITIVSVFAKPPELLVRLLRSYEYGDLKSFLSAIAAGESKPPAYTNLGRFGTVHFDAYPDLAAMVRGTEFEFLLSEKLPADYGESGAMLVQAKLDKQYYTLLWESLFKLPRADRGGIEAILGEEIALRNIVWALRLRTYYAMSAEEVREKLVFLSKTVKPASKKQTKGRIQVKRTAKYGKDNNLASEAEATLNLPLDTFAPWASWKRVSMLNRAANGDIWIADPRYFQNAASRYLYRMARLSFRRSPFSISTAACFIKLKQFEEDLMTSIAEGLGLGMPGRDVFSLLEVEA
jgi:vacuolar-type H+-ATPase subunit C/Vma6